MGNVKVTSATIQLKDHGGGVWGSVFSPPSALLGRKVGAKPTGYPNVVQFRDVLQDSGQVTKNITITNHGDESATLNSVVVDNSEFTLALPPIPSIIDAGGSIIVGVIYNPVSGAAITDIATVVLSYDETIDQTCHVWSHKITSAKSNIAIYNTGSTQFLDQDNTIYTLQENITTTDIAFVAGSKYSELDLNGFTITYNTGGTDYSAGIYNAGDFAQTPPVRVGFTSTSCAGLHVYGGGSIVEGSTTSEYSHCIHFMQNSLRYGLLIEDVELIPKGIASIAIGPEAFARSIVQNVTAPSEVDTINNRHSLEGYIIRLISNTSNLGYLFENVFVSGGAQGGIACSGDGSLYVNVTSKHVEQYVNGFGIHLGAANGTRVYNSTIEPTSGRGLGLMENSADLWAWNNTIDVISTLVPKGDEGTEPKNAYGIQFEDTVDPWTWDNDITGRADTANSYVIRTTNMVDAHYVYNSTINAVRVGATTKIAAIYAGAGSQYLEGANNVCTTDQTYFYTAYDPFSDATTYNDTVITGTNPAPAGSGSANLWFATFARGGAPSTSLDIKVVDITTDIPFSQIYGQPSATALYSIYQSYTTQFEDNVGTVTYSVIDEQSNPSDSGVSDTGGVLITYQDLNKYYNDTSSALLADALGEHTYSAVKSGYTTINGAFTSNSAQVIDVTMEAV